MATNQQSQGGARSQRHMHPPTPQPEQQQQQQQRIARSVERRSLPPTSDTSLEQASADIESMWQRVIQSVDMSDYRFTQSGSPRRTQRVRLNGGSPPAARDDAGRAGSGEPRSNPEDSNNDEVNANDRDSIQQVDGWTFVNLRPWDISRPGEPSLPPPRVRRRLARAPSLQPPREGTSRPVQLPPFLGAAAQNRNLSFRLRDASDNAHIDDIRAPVTRGRTLLFSTDDVDDNIDSERSLSDGAEDYGGVDADANGDPDDFDDWFVRSFSNNIFSQAANTTRSGLLTRLHRAGLSMPARNVPKGPGATTVVRQPWNRDRLWRPYVYQTPIAEPPRRFRDAGGRYKHSPLPEDDTDSMPLYAINSGVRPLSLKCTNADDMGRGSLNNLFFPNSSLFLTSRARNVHLELSFDSDPSSASSRARHHVVERILIMSSMVAPPCTEVMVFASSRRCNFSELSKYDNFTFADYERLSAKYAHQNTKSFLKDPLPIAYFWLSIEEEYEQLQNLPQGICCKYLYFKLLRGVSSDPKMSLRMIRVFGWDGPRTFSDAAIC
ncbi:hypothetical protein H4R20_004932 [Coemansia guatemalensis]|uniref:Uncharacterized protein n=1 Tax=Coemansia guatemalensis TaxID=2761395 RepID=A0A9W8HXQ9_9FUNG|nr:hypothetical protein H4R20_004932 [Coemansia guatemalensis]